MAVKLPLEVSAGDKIQMPLILTNDTTNEIEVDLAASFGELLALTDGEPTRSVKVPANQRTSLFFPIDVTGIKGTSPVSFSAAAKGLSDQFAREVVVVPRGLRSRSPFSCSLSPPLSRAGVQVFGGGSAIAINDNDNATPYPSTVLVSAAV